ncbi:MAG: hypothetical protein WCO29_18630 [Nostocales cyanobacterium ELA583]
MTDFEWEIIEPLLPQKKKTRPYFDIIKQWCEDGILDKIMTELHGLVREQVKKSPVDDFNHD